MVTTLCATWLAVLTALPFTAPFATLDLTDVLGRPARSVVATVAVPAASAGQNDAADDATASGVCIQRHHALELCPLVPVSSPVHGDGLAPVTSILTPRAPAASADDASTRAAILRV